MRPRFRLKPNIADPEVFPADIDTSSSRTASHSPSSLSPIESKAHNRKTSIIGHSRNGSFANGSYANLNSPLSIVAAAGGERPDAFGDPAFTAMSMSSDATLVPDHTHRRMNSGRSRKDHGHSHSHSRHHKAEPKSVGEYALHVLFTSVSTLGIEIEFVLTTQSLLPRPKKRSVSAQASLVNLSLK